METNATGLRGVGVYAHPNLVMGTMTALNCVVIPLNGCTLFVLIFMIDDVIKRPSHGLTVSLTVADMFSGIPFYLQFMSTPVVCGTFVIVPDLVLQFIILWSLVGMAFDHYVAICLPLRYYALITKTFVFVSLIVIWIAGVMLSYAVTLYSAVLSLFTQAVFCHTISKEENVGTGLAITLSGYVIGVFLLCALYTRVFIEVIRFHKVHTQNDSTENMKSKLSSLKTAFLILGGFFIFWMPITIVASHAIRGYSTGISLDLARVWIQVNALYDPLIYCIRMPDVRNGYKKLSIKIRKKLIRQQTIDTMF